MEIGSEFPWKIQETTSHDKETTEFASQTALFMGRRESSRQNFVERAPF